MAVLLLLAALALSPQVVQGQSQSGPPAAPQKPPAESQTTPTITKNVNLVNVLFTVTNKKKQLVTGLTKSDFEVFEDNRPQTVEFFTHESNL
ncbi:MAG: VWA domain-containing protein, partial [Acidobacteriota bacterium]|nr:VWA domain-containing protein [Acidobacteriota bacterium]